MKRIKLTIAYDGTAYCGWQKQDGAVTIQETVEKAIRRLTGAETELIGASRTDSGVHALGNVAVFDTESSIPGEKYMPALNSFLSDDIRIMASEETTPEFHPRFDAHKKQYEYHIVTGEVCSPLEVRYAYHIRESVDVKAMNEMARYAVGTYDFTSFCAAGAQVKSKVRTITDITVTEDNGHIVVAVEGDGFLYNMVRILVGTLLLAGLHRKEPADMKAIIDAMDRTKAGPTVPANGLRLCKIWYQ